MMTQLLMVRLIFLLAPFFYPKLEGFIFCSHDPILPDFRLFHTSEGNLSSD